MATTVLRTVASAVAGGTASLLGGGKFANGAFSGAFVYLFNKRLEKQELDYMRAKRAAIASAYEKAWGKQAHSRMFDKTPTFDKVVKVGEYALKGALLTSYLAKQACATLSVEIASFVSGGVTGAGFGLISNSSGIDPLELKSNILDSAVEKYK